MSTFSEQLKSLDPNDPGRWPLPFRLGAIGLAFVIALAALFYLIAWKPKKPELDEARAKETTLLTELGNKAKKAANLDEYKAQLQEMERSFGAMLRQLPNKTEVPNLLVDISQQALAAGLEEKLFQPQPDMHKDFYAEKPIKIRQTGSFHAIGNFVSGVAALPRIVTLHDITITSLSKEPGVDNLQLEVTAKTYRYLDDEEQAAADAQKDAQKKAAQKGK